MAMIVHMFPGQGAFFSGALRSVQRTSPEVGNVIRLVDGVSRTRFGRPLADLLLESHFDTTQLVTSDAARLQLAIYAISVASHELLCASGYGPDVLMGHSFGEIAALACAGVFSIEQGAEIVCDRIECLALAAPRDGCMAAVSTSPSSVRLALQDWKGPADLAVAVENHDGQTVVSGPRVAVASFVTFCESRKLTAQMLHAPYGFHNAALLPVTEVFAARLSAYPYAPPRRPVYSPILKRFYRPDEAFGDCLARHLVMPVAFSSAVRLLSEQGASVYIECGALDGLTKIVGRILGREGARTFATFTPASVSDGGIGPIVTFLKENQKMNAPIPPNMLPEFETFWRERSPFVMALLKSEFVSFLLQQRPMQWTPVDLTAPMSRPDTAPIASPTVAPAHAPAHAPVTAPAASRRRDELMTELAAIYAEAMEYPQEVFTEAVELEAELGIDSVKQTEIMGRISEQYQLPRLPSNVRISEFKTMGQIVDLVFANQGKATIPA